jgi:AbrB family looped-hinge helix DNA binding protein
MTSATMVVNEQGRVTIPASIRQDLGLRSGSQLVAYVEDGRLVLEDRGRLLRRVQAKLRQPAGSLSVVDELIEDRRAAAGQENNAEDDA